MVINQEAIDTVRKNGPLKEGRSKRLYHAGDGIVLVDLIPSLRSFTHDRDEFVVGTEVLRLDFYEQAAARLTAKGINNAFISRVGPHSYIAKACEESPIEVIVKNVATGSTIKKYPGLFDEGHRFSQPVVKFDYRTDPEDQCLADDYLREIDQDPIELKRIALDVNSTLREWLYPRELLDFCIVIGTDPAGNKCVLSEISPDAMRLRSAEGEPLDKDIFRQGRPNSELIATWSKLVETLT